MRFFIGVLSSQTIFMDGDRDDYEEFSAQATKNVILAVASTQKLSTMTASDMVVHFCKNENNETGDFYLGYNYIGKLFKLRGK